MAQGGSVKYRISPNFLILLALVLGLGAFSVIITSPAMADHVATPKTLDRDLEPVIVTGAAVSALVHFPVDQLFVYAYSGSAWKQIPSQVDEITATGDYTTTEDGLLDANDEIVFMAKDLGDQAPESTPITGSLTVSPGWYELQVTDPINPAHTGWAYLVHSRVLTQTFAADYVNFDPATHRINGETYSLGFATPHAWADYLTLGNSGVNILDRTKIRFGPFTEEVLPSLPDNLIKDGPVRAILRGGKVLAYGSMASLTTAVSLPQGLTGSIRLSTDFNAAATGALYYNAVVPAGVTVDGDPDTVPATPLSPWWQLSTNTGTLIQVQDAASLGGTQSNYYVDNATFDSSDTGDHRHYGDTGISIQNPNPAFTYIFVLYVLLGTQPNVGATYEAFFTHPLSAMTVVHGDPRPEKIYLPVIEKNTATGRK
jgi:hypothetical protein